MPPCQPPIPTPERTASSRPFSCSAPIEDIVQTGPDTWRIRGTAPLKDVSRILEVPLPSEDYDTLNGLIFDALGAVPEDGASVDVGGDPPGLS